MKKRIHIISDEEGRSFFINLIRGISLQRALRITIEHHVQRRSSNQNSLYWIWMHAVADDTGHTAHEMHEYFKRQFLEAKTMEIGGHAVDIPRSTRDLSVTEFTEYMERVSAFVVSELGLALNMPGEQWVH